MPAEPPGNPLQQPTPKVGETRKNSFDVSNHSRVIVKLLESETKTASGIFIPDAATEKPDQGEVLAVGPGKRNDKGDFVALNVAVGDRVLFGKYSGQTVKVDGDELLVMREEDLFAVIAK